MAAFVLTWLFYTSFASPQLLNASKYTKENVRIFDDIYTYGMWDLQFNESLYSYQGFGSVSCFSNTSCRSPNIACDPCDWTNPLICNGTLRGLNSSCPCSNPPALCYPNRWTNDKAFWSNTDTSVTVEIFKGLIDISYHPVPPNNCSCIIFKVDVFEGTLEGFMIYYGETWSGSDGPNYVLSRHGTVTICPSESIWGHTYIVRLIASFSKALYAKVRVSIEYRNITSSVHSSSCIVPLGLPSGYQCVPTNVLTTLSPINNDAFVRIVIDPPVTRRCGVIGFWASSVEHLLSTNPYVSPQNSTNVYRTHRESSGDGRPWPSLYPYCLNGNEKLYAFVLSSTPVTFFIDVANEWMLLRPFTDYTPVEFYKRFLGAVTVNCPSRNYTAHRTTYAVSEDIDTGSANLRMVYPSNDLDVFYPSPIFGNEPYTSLLHIPVQPLTPGRIAISLILSQRLNNRVQPLAWKRPWFPNAYSWLTVDEWKYCNLTLGGNIADKQGNSLRMTVRSSDITSGLVDCDPIKYSNVSATIDSISSNASLLVTQSGVTLSSIYRLWFLQDRMASSNDFYSCYKETENYYTSSPLSSIPITTSQCLNSFNTQDYNNDTCCRLNSSTLYSDCAPSTRLVHGQITVLSFTPMIGQCSADLCVKSSLNNLVLSSNLEKDPGSCNNFIERPADETVYWQCINRIWGPEVVSFAGVKCVHDSDCGSGICNVYSKRCIIDISFAEHQLIDCVYNGLSQFTRTFVSSELGINTSLPNQTSLWYNAFLSTLPCSDPYTPVGFDLDWLGQSGCQGCNGFALGTTTPISSWKFSPGTSWAEGGFDCYAPGSTQCNSVALKIAGAGYCSFSGCNHIPYINRGYFPFITSPSVCTNKTFCGVSDDGFFFDDITPSIPLSSCNGIACFLANKTVIPSVDSSSCNSIYSCDTMCGSSACTTQQNCLLSGSCSDASDYDIGIWTRNYANETMGCFFEIRYREPFNPTVSVCESPFRNTILGCSMYPGPSGSLIDEVRCKSGNFSWGDPSIFQLISPKWIKRATSAQECMAYGTVCNDPTKPRIGAMPAYTNTRSFSSKCTNQIPLYTWTQGRWLPGQARTMQLTVGKLSRRFNPTPRQGLYLPRILSNITKAVDKLQSLKVQSSSFCHNNYKLYLDQVICSCLGGYKESFCYKKKVNVSSIGVACDEDSTISSGDILINIRKESMAPATCQSIFISTASIVSYAKRDIVPLRTLLVNYAEDVKYGIRNSQLAIYGKVLTNGYSFNFSLPVSNITMCIQLSSYQMNYVTEMDKYPVLDLARRPINSMLDDLVPLNYLVSTTIDGNKTLFCADVDRLKYDYYYYIIIRADANYADVERTVFTRGEIAYISILLTLYTIGLLCSVTKLGYIFYVDHRNLPIRLTLVMFLISVFFLFRVILFSLLLNQSLLNLTTARAVNYLLFEFPILLYFAFVTNYACTWFTASMLIKDFNPNHKRNLNLANNISILLNGVIFVMFIVFIILFETIVYAPYLICGGEIVLFDSRTFTLLLIYRVVFSTIAIILGILLFLIAMKFGHYLSDKTFNISATSRMKLYSLSIIGGLGLISQAIYFLVITVIESTPVNYASLTILLVLEIIPAMLFIFVESVRRNIRSLTSGSGSHSVSSDNTSSK